MFGERFGYDNKTVCPLHISAKRDVTHESIYAERWRQTTLLSDKKKPMSRLLNDRTKHNGEDFHCNYCLHAFMRQDMLGDHVQYCQSHGPQRIIVPSEDDKWLQLKHLAHQLRVSAVIYAGFECYTEPIEVCQPAAAASQDNQHHTPSGFFYYIVSVHPEHTFDPESTVDPMLLTRF